MTDLSTTADRLLHAATKAGADAADTLCVAGTALDISVRNGALESADRSEGVDVGLRVFVGNRVAVVSASDTSAATIDQMAERAVAMAREAPEDPFAGLADPDQLATTWPDLDLNDTSTPPTAAALQDTALRAEAAALAVPGVTQTDVAAAGQSQRQIWLATTGGFSAGYTRTGHYVNAVAISGSGTGMERDYDGDMRAHHSDLRSPEDIGQRAGERATAMQGARRPATGACAVLFDERISSSLIAHLMQAANGAMVARGSSWLRDKLSKPVLPDGIDLIEDPHRPRIGGSRPFDGEGLPTQRRAVVQDGCLMGFTVDLAYARQLGVAPTGNGARGTGAGPSPSVGNLTLTQGTETRDEMLRRMGTGLWVTSLIGSTINPNTGDYSRGASGFWVENGQVVHPVTEVTIAGSLPDFLRRIEPAGDARDYLSRVVPSLLVQKGLTLAGD